MKGLVQADDEVGCMGGTDQVNSKGVKEGRRDYRRDLKNAKEGLQCI